MATRMNRLMILALALGTCVGCDQVTKYTAKQFLSPGSVTSLAGDTIRLQYVENTGAFLSFGASLPHNVRYGMFTIGVSILSVALCGYIFFAKQLTIFAVLALSLILGGGVGNLLDRIFYDGAVIDFLNVGIGSLRTGIFNVADFIVLVGTGLLLWSEVTKSGKNPLSSDE